MTRLSLKTGLLSAALVAGATALALAQSKPASAPAAAGTTHAVCVLHATEGNTAHGIVRFTAQGGKVRVVADIEGLTPNSEHAMHIHEFGDCSAPDGTSTGGHYNPEGHEHGLPDKAMRHAGDFGNLKADASGKAHLELIVDNLSIAGPKNPVVGYAMIVHAKPDDGGQPTGNAGGRIACGVIGIANP